MLWGTNELLSSFDSINVTAPSAKSGVGHDTRSWLHVDQAPLRRGFFCVQGIVNMVDVGPDTTGGVLFVSFCLARVRLRQKNAGAKCAPAFLSGEKEEGSDIAVFCSS